MNRTHAVFECIRQYGTPHLKDYYDGKNTRIGILYMEYAATFHKAAEAQDAEAIRILTEELDCGAMAGSHDCRLQAASLAKDFVSKHMQTEQHDLIAALEKVENIMKSNMNRDKKEWSLFTRKAKW